MLQIPDTPIRLLITHEPPGVFDNCNKFPLMERSEYCPFPGWILEITTIISSFLNVSIEATVGQTADYGGGVGNLVNDTWRGLLGAVFNESIDTVAILYQFTEQRHEHFDFSFPVTNIEVVYISRTKTRTVSSYLWNVTRPYGNTLWATLVGSWVTQILVAVIIRKFEHKMEYIEHYDPFEKIWQYCRLQIHQGEDRKRPFQSKTGHVAFAVYALLQATLFSYLYQASLLASLLQPADLAPFKTADEMIGLIRSGEFKMLATRDNFKSSWYFTELAQSNDAHFRQLREAMVSNPIVLTGSIDAALEMVSKGNYIYPAQQDSLSLIRMRRHCNLFKFCSGLPQKSAYFLFRKKSKWLRSWDYGIKMNQEFISRTVNKYFEQNYLLGPVAVCPTTKDEIPEYQRPLDIIAAFGIFIIYAIGLSVAGVAFGCEVWVVHHAKRVITRHSSRVLLRVQQLFDGSRDEKGHRRDDRTGDVTMASAWPPSEALNANGQPVGCKTNETAKFSINSFENSAESLI